MRIKTFFLRMSPRGLKRTSRKLLVSVGLAAAVTTSLVHAVSGSRSAQIGSSREVGAVPQEQSPGADQVVLACPGRIEGATETVKVGAGISGVLQMVPVEEGQWVNAGDVLARFDCADLEAESQVAESALEVAQQSRRRLLRGSREEERKEANAGVVKAEAIGRQAGVAYDRTMDLFKRKVASQDDLDRARRDNAVSEASLRRAREHAQLIDAPPLPEEVARADAEVQLAQNRLLETRHRFDKCTIRAPISGVVLRRYLQGGESVSVAFPHVIVAVADTSKYRARGEVDERDVGRVALGQTVVLSADALSGAITGRVSSIGHAMGRKSVYSGEPSEKKDQDILEVLVDLDQTTQRLLVGLRVTLRFVSSAEHAGQSEQPFVVQ